MLFKAVIQCFTGDSNQSASKLTCSCCINNSTGKKPNRRLLPVQ